MCTWNKKPAVNLQSMKLHFTLLNYLHPFLDHVIHISWSTTTTAHRFLDDDEDFNPTSTKKMRRYTKEEEDLIKEHFQLSEKSPACTEFLKDLPTLKAEQHRMFKILTASVEDKLKDLQPKGKQLL
jgi:hypothetical protein